MNLLIDCNTLIIPTFDVKPHENITSVKMLRGEDPNETEIIIHFKHGDVVIEFYQQDVILK